MGKDFAFALLDEMDGKALCFHGTREMDLMIMKMDGWEGMGRYK
jgi:hypothetical protein